MIYNILIPGISMYIIFVLLQTRSTDKTITWVKEIHV